MEPPSSININDEITASAPADDPLPDNSIAKSFLVVTSEFGPDGFRNVCEFYSRTGLLYLGMTSRWDS